VHALGFACNRTLLYGASDIEAAVYPYVPSNIQMANICLSERSLTAEDMLSAP